MFWLLILMLSHACKNSIQQAKKVSNSTVWLTDQRGEVSQG